MREQVSVTLSQSQNKDRFHLQDTIALIIQAVGGGLASGTQPVLGAHIALGGIAIQLRSVSYSICSSKLH